MSNKVCDHKSVGILVWKNNKLLLIERKRPPYGFAPPAGHVDNDPSFSISAKRELKEEVGLTATTLKLLLKGRKNNPCRRLNGHWHYWKIYQAGARGKVSPSHQETKQVNYFTHQQIQELALKTKKYLTKKIRETQWREDPGLEPVWYQWFNKLKIIRP